MLLSVTDAQKIYPSANGTVRALDGVSLELGAGEFTAVRGQSGSGKTTLLLLAGGLLAPDGGTVMINGQDPYKMASDARAHFRSTEIGFVFQQFHLIPYLSVLDNVLAASIPTHPADAKQRASELLAKFGLEHRLHHVPGQLSVGERQRTALARALLNQPKLILADEPTGNLDRENAEAVLGHLTEFANEGGAVLLVTHDDEAASRAKRTIHMAAGKVVE
ncbi:Lipoprotein-releasing system ATP-binding protein LolD [Symmachiella dynata]|uniref:Lipoprotein-releasing system ATP-binding protein LolD n=1 Tax=Symmachiella dynata TaxID=2527995 RepID=A0A517ZRI7_9PLAN|nr:ABC transporter ATP-binding protein [Symmachiella dynata]QDU45099.1 Lipoprotein-releasing system ATP-binding protein LolD [Symmachiella dynata]